MTPHLYVAISFHGFGHIAQTAAVINELRRRLPDMRLTIRCAAPNAVLNRRFSSPFHHIQEPVDIGMLMGSAIEVLREKSAEAYIEFHKKWQQNLDHEVDILKTVKPDLVFANVPYLTLAAAGKTKSPALALCSLNWADIFHHYCATHRQAGAIREQMMDAYHTAKVFLKPRPSMDMPDLENGLEIGPIARIGINRRADIQRKTGLSAQERLILIAPGGLNFPVNFDAWPRLPDTRWLVQQDWGVRHVDTINIESLEMDFVDVLASCDAIVTKPGYGTFTEAVCNRIPVLYIRRFDWPEEPALISWLHNHGRALEMEQEDLQLGNLREYVEKILVENKSDPIAPTGIKQAVDTLQEYLY
jgi:hypothetical protein